MISKPAPASNEQVKERSMQNSIRMLFGISSPLKIVLTASHMHLQIGCHLRMDYWKAVF